MPVGVRVVGGTAVVVGRRRSSGLLWSRSLGRVPVSVKKTSSRAGRRRAISSSARLAPSSARTATMSLSARHRQAAAHASIRERQPHRARAPRRRAPVLGDAGAHVEDVAAGSGLELVGRPVATSRPRSMIATRSARWSASSRVTTACHLADRDRSPPAQPGVEPVLLCPAANAPLPTRSDRPRRACGRPARTAPRRGSRGGSPRSRARGRALRRR